MNIREELEIAKAKIRWERREKGYSAEEELHEEEEYNEEE